MAFKLVSAGGSNVEPTMIEVLASGAVSVGDHVSPTIEGSHYTTDKYVARLGSTTTHHTLFAISAGSINSGTAYISVIPINSAQIWEADATATCATTQYFKANALSTYSCVANAAASVSATVGSTGVWVNLAYVGATTDKKMLGRFNNPQTGDP